MDLGKVFLVFLADLGGRTFWESAFKCVEICHISFAPHYNNVSEIINWFRTKSKQFSVFFYRRN